VSTSGAVQWLRWAAVGASAGVVLGALPLVTELFVRLANDVRDIGGESQDWGEPLFYMVLRCSAGAVAGAVVGTLSLVVYRLTRR
jgi:hypothetical protein